MIARCLLKRRPFFPKPSPSLLILSCIVFFSYLGFPSRASACTPPPGSEAPTLAERYERSSHVFVGSVIATNLHLWEMPFRLPPMIDPRGFLGTHYGRFFGTVDRQRGYYALIRVQAFYKGGGIGEVVVEGYGSRGDCLNTVLTGETWLFFANGDMPFLGASYSGYPYSAVDEAAPSVLAELEIITDKPATAPDATRAYVWLPLAGAALAVCWLAARGTFRLALRPQRYG
jgi:hypothetical protein